MKEFTIEEKAKAYDEALEKARKEYKNHKAFKGFCEMLVHLFPQLKESEDEKIWKELISFVRRQIECHDKPNAERDEKFESWIAWVEKQAFNVDNANKEYWRGYREGKQEILDKYAELEKQSEQKSTFEMKTPEESLGIDSDTYNKIVDECIYGEQKPTDKVEPKFHKGDWIIHQGTENIYQVVARIDNQYQLRYGDNYTIQKCADVDRCARLWDITKDAKDGDVLAVENMIFVYKAVLASHVVSYCKLVDNIFESTSDARTCCKGNTYVHPATKEQRDTLMKAMADAGYEWDYRKKELHKVKEDLTEFENALANKSTKRSDEDEKYLNIVYSVINQPSAQGIYDYHNVDKTDVINWLKSRVHPKQEWSKDDITRINEIIETLNIVQANRVRTQRMHYSKATIDNNIVWLKSLKDRVHPKQEWSEEDEKMFNRCVNTMKGAYYLDGEALYWLENRFKSLRPQPKQEWSEEDKKMIINICKNLYDYPRVNSPFDNNSFKEAQKQVDWFKSRVQPRQE